jgi:hypothetical protein
MLERWAPTVRPISCLVSNIAHTGFTTSGSESSIIAKRSKYPTVCNDFEQSGHLKKRTSYCASTGCLSVNSIVVLQTVQGSLEFTSGFHSAAILGLDDSGPDESRSPANIAHFLGTFPEFSRV